MSTTSTTLTGMILAAALGVLVATPATELHKPLSFYKEIAWLHAAERGYGYPVADELGRATSMDAETDPRRGQYHYAAPVRGTVTAAGIPGTNERGGFIGGGVYQTF